VHRILTQLAEVGIIGQARRDIAAYYAGASYMSFRVVNEKRDGKHRMHYLTMPDFMAVGRYLFRAVIDNVFNLGPGTLLKGRKKYFDELAFELGMECRTRGFETVKFWPGSLKAWQQRSHVFTHIVDPQGLYLPPRLMKYSGGWRGSNGNIKGVRPFDLDEPIDKERHLGKLVDPYAPKPIEKSPKPTHIPDTSWLFN